MCTGALAGHNAVRYALGIPMLILPRSIAIGDLIAYANDKLLTKEGRKDRYTFAGAKYFERMKAEGLYTIDKKVIEDRVAKVNLKDVFKQRLV